MLADDGQHPVEPGHVRVEQEVAHVPPAADDEGHQAGDHPILDKTSCKLRAAVRIGCGADQQRAEGDQHERRTAQLRQGGQADQRAEQHGVARRLRTPRDASSLPQDRRAHACGQRIVADCRTNEEELRYKRLDGDGGRDERKRGQQRTRGLESKGEAECPNTQR